MATLLMLYPKFAENGLEYHNSLTNLRRKTKTKGAGLEVEVVTVVEVTVEVTEIKIITIGGPPPISDVQFMRGCPCVLPNELTDLLDLEC